MGPRLTSIEAGLALGHARHGRLIGAAQRPTRPRRYQNLWRSTYLLPAVVVMLALFYSGRHRSFPLHSSSWARRNCIITVRYPHCDLLIPSTRVFIITASAKYCVKLVQAIIHTQVKLVCIYKALPIKARTEGIFCNIYVGQNIYRNITIESSPASTYANWQVHSHIVLCQGTYRILDIVR